MSANCSTLYFNSYVSPPFELAHLRCELIAVELISYKRLLFSNLLIKLTPKWKFLYYRVVEFIGSASRLNSACILQTIELPLTFLFPTLRMLTNPGPSINILTGPGAGVTPHNSINSNKYTNKSRTRVNCNITYEYNKLEYKWTSTSDRFPFKM